MDIAELKKLLSEGKELEAQEWLEDFLESAITPREQGKAIITMISSHMAAQNALNEEHIRILKNAELELQSLNKNESSTTDAIKLVKTRKEIGQHEK